MILSGSITPNSKESFGLNSKKSWPVTEWKVTLSVQLSSVCYIYRWVQTHWTISYGLNNYVSNSGPGAISGPQCDYIWSQDHIKHFNLKYLFNASQIWIKVFSIIFLPLLGSRHRWPAGYANIRRILRLLQDDVSTSRPLPTDDVVQWQEGSPDGWRAG